MQRPVGQSQDGVLKGGEMIMTVSWGSTILRTFLRTPPHGWGLVTGFNQQQRITLEAVFPVSAEDDAEFLLQFGIDHPVREFPEAELLPWTPVAQSAAA